MWLPLSIGLLIGGLALVSTREVFTLTAMAWLWPILVGGLASVLSLVKSIAAKRVGDPNTASTLKTWTAKTPPPEFVNDEEHTDG